MKNINPHNNWLKDKHDSIDNEDDMFGTSFDQNNNFSQDQKRKHYGHVEGLKIVKKHFHKHKEHQSPITTE